MQDWESMGALLVEFSLPQSYRWLKTFFGVIRPRNSTNFVAHRSREEQLDTPLFVVGTNAYDGVDSIHDVNCELYLTK